ncbi:hypothetical protein GGF37_005985, partial [Kickxella alabastrina]
MSTDKCTLIPEQLFESQEAFIMHVKRYAMENGFNVRLDDVERDKGGLIRKRDIVCSSEGAPRSKDSLKREGSPDRFSDVEGSELMTPSRPGIAHSGVHRRKSMKTGCRWLARASRQSSGMWKIIMLRLEHNHELVTRYELAMVANSTVRSGDIDSVSAAALAARGALEGGSYCGPSVEFKNLFLQMSAACADLCWAAARHPETIAEVMSEIRRLHAHLEKHQSSADGYDAAADAPLGTRAHSTLPAISENGDVDADSENARMDDGSLVMMGGQPNGPMPGHTINHSPPQPSHFLGVPHLISQIDATIAESPVQILARSQNRHVQDHSPELNTAPGSFSAASAAAAATAAATAAAAAAATSTMNVESEAANSPVLASMQVPVVPAGTAGGAVK